jgi:hypothetical protein
MACIHTYITYITYIHACMHAYIHAFVHTASVTRDQGIANELRLKGLVGVTVDPDVIESVDGLEVFKVQEIPELQTTVRVWIICVFL